MPSEVSSNLARFDAMRYGLRVGDDFLEVRRKQQVGQRGIGVEGFLDLAEEPGADDAPAAPEQGVPGEAIL